MTQSKFYVQVPVEKELPENPEATIMAKEYMTDNGWLLFEGNNDPQINWYDNNLDKYYVCKWWLKEISITDLMVEFAKECDGISERGHLGDRKYYEVLKEFLQSKGYSI